MTLTLPPPAEKIAPPDDWTFSGAATRDVTHCYHDYPARMIPQVARRLLSTFGENARTLFDPYCGTGTSLVEGRLRGLSVVGTDLNPLARLIASAKTDDVPLDALDAALSRFAAEPKVANLLPEFPKGEVPEGISRLDFWFKPEVIGDLARLRGFLRTIEPEPVRRFFEVAFSETVRDCSNTRPNEFKLYRRAVEDLSDFSPNVFRTMQTKLTRNRAGLVDFLCKLENLPVCPPPARVFAFNTVDGIPAEVLPPESVDIVLTSPPYGDSGTTVAYGQYSRLSSEWLGLPDPASVDRRLMGGGRGNAVLPVFASDALNEAIKRVGDVDAKRAGEVGAFYRDLEASIEHVALLLRPNGYACYVVGNRRVKGVVLPTDDAVRRAFERHGFLWHDTFFRAIPNKRMPLKNSPSNIAGASDATMTREFIVVMRRCS